jgi:hypothetical protein
MIPKSICSVGKRDDDEDDNIPSKKSRLEEQTIIDEGEDVAFTKLAVWLYCSPYHLVPGHRPVS